ncbi:hypothetical protein O6H91_05G046400 [Diphasiastrum complanatum]|uniref:Uncharacterized protein n=2 Tax=Diphasiastrum complanatum TaxID=34168 RepID=A0ACC2DMS3_DIPCM|nr:hypothetical protein O6H91_05G046400 [Diphasiastrum complanatum]
MGSEAQSLFNLNILATGYSTSEGMAPPVEGIGKFSLPRQNSIYTLTLDEFQNAVAEPGKSFGSMNMDEFLKNIWTVEESQAMAAAIGGGPITQASLPRQASLTLPRTLSRKTVDEVWMGIQQGPSGNGNTENKRADQQDRQITLGEMTLEDFLVKAGVFMEELGPGSRAFAPNGSVLDNKPSIIGGIGSTLAKKVGGWDGERANAGVASAFSLSPVSALASQSAFDGVQPDGLKLNYSSQHAGWNINGSYQNANVAAVNQQKLLQQQAELTAYLKGTKRMGEETVNTYGVEGRSMGALKTTVEGGLVEGIPGGNLGIQLGTGVNGIGLGARSPPGPISDGVGPGQVNGMSFSLVGNYGVDGGLRGRKRGPGHVEKIVERRQRRMIKNRESAARSRARKQVWKMSLSFNVGVWFQCVTPLVLKSESLLREILKKGPEETKNF